MCVKKYKCVLILCFCKNVFTTDLAPSKTPRKISIVLK